MRKMMVTAMVVGLAAGIGAAHSAPKLTKLGAWTVSSERDAFDDAQVRVIAMLPSAQGVLAVRCLSHEMSIAFMPIDRRYKDADLFEIKIRAGGGAIYEFTGTALDNGLLAFDVSRKVVEDIGAALDLALRIEGRTQSDFAFKTGPQAAKAMQAVLDACKPVSPGKSGS
jgi:hypothetical protein